VHHNLRDIVLYFCRAENPEDGVNKFNRNKCKNISQYKLIPVYLMRLSVTQDISVIGRFMNELEGSL
jgi:hypothetical protein